MSHALDTLMNYLELGVYATQLAHLDSPNLVEWTMTFHYHAFTKDVSITRPFVIVTALHCVQLLAMNAMDALGLLNKYRLIPTGAIGLVQIAYFVCNIIAHEGRYPVLFFIARIPEVMTLFIIMTVYSLYGLSKVLAGENVREFPLRYHTLPLGEDFGAVLFNLGVSCLNKTRSMGYLNELEPIQVPLGLGISPERSHQVRLALEHCLNGFTRNLDEEERTSGRPLTHHRKPPSILTNNLRIWLVNFSFLYTFLEFFWRILAGGRRGPSRAESVSERDVNGSMEEEDADEDYAPSEEDEGAEEEVSDSSVDSEDDDGNSSDVPLEELFDLARDLNENEYQGVTPLLMLTRTPPRATRRSVGRNSPGGSRGLFAWDGLVQPSIIEGNWSFSTRLCVICQTHPRSIVLRPCGCLCLCDEGCRLELAARQYGDCPCCRRRVQGFSKVFEP